MKKNKRWLVAVTLATLLSTSTIFAETNIAETDTDKKTTDSTVQSITVSTTAYKDVATNIAHTVGGIVPAAQDSNISAQISAVINAFHVDTGYSVNKGDLLVSLDCRENQLKMKQSSANLKAEEVRLAHAKTQFNQAKKLNKQGNISKELYNQREAEENRIKATVENKKAALAISKLNVERCEIKAPYDGYITKRNASVGELTQPGTHLLQLISKSNNIVEVKINNRLLDSFTNGKNYLFEFNNKQYPIKVDFILPVLDTKTRNHIARLSFIENQAITGSVGKVIWLDADKSIPANFIVQRNNQQGIFIVEDNATKNTARFVAVESINESKVPTTKLDDDTLVVTKGRFSVNDGDTLKILNN